MYDYIYLFSCLSPPDYVVQEGKNHTWLVYYCTPVGLALTKGSA